MNISFAKDFKHNYLVINDERILSGDYQINMMIKNPIKGLMSCQERMINGEGLLHYDVTSRQSFFNYYENNRIRLADMENLFGQVKSVIKNLQRYILCESGLVLSPEFIYMDIETKEIRFLYYPYYEQEEENSLISLLEFILSRTDGEDMKAIEAVYQMLDIVSRQHMCAEEVAEWYLREYGAEDMSISEDTTNMESVCENVNDEALHDDNDVDEYTKPIGWIKRLIAFFKGDKRETDDYWEEIETDLSYEKQVHEENSEKQEETVYIPWVENTEQKLYGLGHNNKYHIDLTKSPLVVGKLKGSVGQVISDNSISRMHAKFMRQGAKYVMQDLNSTNGCFKNGMRLSPNETVTIEPGDEIGLGKLKFIYR